MTDASNTDADTAVRSGQFSPSTGRLPADIRLGHVRLQVGDLARSLAYYTGVMGLEVKERTTDSATLTAVGSDLPLVQLVARPGTEAVPLHGRLGLYHFALLVPDRSALGRFLAHLAQTGTRIGASDHLVSEAIYLRDPDGLGIEVYRDRPRSEWRRVQGQIEMASEPLDMESVLAAAEGEPWSGMAAGTVMGHMHLHVADINAASRFYHEALGLDRTVWSYPGALFLSAGGYHHHLGVNTWAGPTARAASDLEAQLLEWRMLFPDQADARAAAGRLSHAGYQVSEDASDWVAADPWGTRLRLTTA